MQAPPARTRIAGKHEREHQRPERDAEQRGERRIEKRGIADARRIVRRREIPEEDRKPLPMPARIAHRDARADHEHAEDIREHLESRHRRQQHEIAERARDRRTGRPFQEADGGADRVRARREQRADHARDRDEPGARRPRGDDPERRGDQHGDERANAVVPREHRIVVERISRDAGGFGGPAAPCPQRRRRTRQAAPPAGRA